MADRGAPTVVRTGEGANGPLTRAATRVYWFLVVEGLWLLTAAPGLVVALGLERDASNLPLYALAAVPLGPATTAAVFAWRSADRDRDQSPAGQFRRGYAVGWRDALRSWVAALAVLTVLGVNLAFGGAVGVGRPLGVLYAVLALVVLLWAVRMLVLAGAYTFRWRDAARLGVWTLTARPLATLGLLSLLVLTAGLAYLTFDAVVVLLASVLTWFLARNEEPVLADVRRRFVVP